MSSERTLNKKLAVIAAALLAIMLILCACGGNQEEQITPEASTEQITEESTERITEESTEPAGETHLKLVISGEEVSVEWEDNEAVSALKELAADGISIVMTQYGGFEQVGPIGTSLPSDNSQMTTEAGDIVLYSGNQMVIFFGSNSWSYTKLGHITDRSGAELVELLNRNSVTVTLGMEYTGGEN